MAAMAGVAPVTEPTNEMWSRTINLVRARKLEYNVNSGMIRHVPGRSGDWRAVVAAHSPYVSHPETVAQVRKWCGDEVISPLVGNAYWPHLLAEAGANVTCYDFRQLWGPKTWFEPVNRLDSSYTVVRQHLTSTMLLVEHDKLDKAARALREFNGPACVFLGVFPPARSPMLKDVMSLWDVDDVYRPPAFWANAPFDVVRLVRPTFVGRSGSEEESSWVAQQRTTLLPSLLPHQLQLPSRPSRYVARSRGGHG
jgi:hypothetical protein